jgi:hypothetical protein
LILYGEELMRGRTGPVEAPMTESIQAVTLEYIAIDDPLAVEVGRATIKIDEVGVARLWAKLPGKRRGDGQWLSVPVNPNGPATLNSIAGRLLALLRVGRNVWELSAPVMLVDRSLWQIRITNVPETESWVTSASAQQPAA